MLAEIEAVSDTSTPSLSVVYHPDADRLNPSFQALCLLCDERLKGNYFAQTDQIAAGVADAIACRNS